MQRYIPRPVVQGVIDRERREIALGEPEGQAAGGHGRRRVAQPGRDAAAVRFALPAALPFLASLAPVAHRLAHALAVIVHQALASTPTGQETPVPPRPQ